jgi:ABC-type arginine/histidine transport system permease subunit
LNVGYRVFTWTATVAVGMEVTPTLAITTGLQGTPLTVTLNSTGYTTGTFTGVITVTATTTDVLDSPRAVPVTLRVVPEVHRVYLPVALRAAR